MKLMQNLLFLIVFFTITIKTDTNLKTSGKKDQKSISFFNLTQNNKIEHLTQRKLESNVEFQEIRIYVDTTYIEYQKENDQNIQTYFSNIISGLNKAKSTITKLLKVQKSNYRINIKDSDLNDWGFDDHSKIDQNLIEGNAGIDADLVIIPIFINEDSELLSVGEPQKLDKDTNRPIVGVLKINQNKIWNGQKNNDYYINSIFLHQFTHILGFTYKMFEYFPGGLKNTTKFGEENRTHINKTFIITDKVVKFAQKYFNCPNINGVELEDTPGNDGLNNSHWEARILLGDYMVSKPYTTEEVISEFTLSLLEDSGWYQVNYYTGGLMRYGKHQGCEFVDEDCMYYNNENGIETHFKNDFLVGMRQTSCSSGRQSRAYRFDYYGSPTIKNYIRFLIDGNYVHGKDIADYCFVSDIYQLLKNTQDYNDEDLIYYVGSCNKGGNEYGSHIAFLKDKTNSDISKLENITEFGHDINNINSFCALSTVIPNKQEYKDLNLPNFAKCYPMNCTERSLTIQINGQYVVCPREGGTVNVNGSFTGNLYCPDYNLICTGTVMCNDMFDCVEKESLSKNNTYDYDYTIETSQVIVNKPDIKVGYEETIDGICPQYCSQCKEKKKCFVCINDYVLVGHRENDEEPITCNKSAGENYYLNKNDNVYYLCMDG